MTIRRHNSSGTLYTDDANGAEMIAAFGGIAVLYASLPFTISASRQLQHALFVTLR